MMARREHASGPPLHDYQDFIELLQKRNVHRILP
jgi:hypothetical protein